MNKHTEGPWKIYCYPGTRISMGRVEVVDRKEAHVFQLSIKDADLIEIIVKAVNCHDDMLGALEEMTSLAPDHAPNCNLQNVPAWECPCDYPRTVGLSAIAKAKGQK